MSAAPAVNAAAPWPDAVNAARASVAAPDHPPVFSLQGVGVRYGRVQALHGVNLSVAPGERVALIGANGCGKSTLLRVLHGLVKPSSGQLLWGDGLRQAMLFQRPYMLRASALYNVALGLWLHGMRWREARALALAALQRVGLQGIAAQSARTLSGGQQQRVALARAWALRPDVLLLDEPTASLDPHAKREVELLMADLGGCRTWSVESENRRFRQNGPQRGQFLPDLQPHSPAMGQKDGVLEERRSQKWTAAADLQPTISKSDSLLAASHGQAGPAHPVTMVFASHNLGQVKRLASRVIYLEHGAVQADLPVHDFFNGPLPDAARLFVKGEMV